MKTKLIRTLAILLGVLFSVPASFLAAPSPEPNIGVAGYFATDKAQRGRALQAAIVIDIPSGYHINSSRPL